MINTVQENINLFKNSSELIRNQTNYKKMTEDNINTPPNENRYNQEEKEITVEQEVATIICRNNEVERCGVSTLSTTDNTSIYTNHEQKERYWGKRSYHNSIEESNSVNEEYDEESVEELKCKGTENEFLVIMNSRLQQIMNIDEDEADVILRNI